MRTNFFALTFWTLPEVRDIPAKFAGHPRFPSSKPKEDKLSRESTNFSATTPSRGRPAHHRAVSAPQKLIFVLFFRKRTHVQQLTCNIDLSSYFYYLFFSFVLIELKPFVLKGKENSENFWKSVQNYETISPFSRCPLVFPWFSCLNFRIPVTWVYNGRVELSLGHAIDHATKAGHGWKQPYDDRASPDQKRIPCIGMS